MLSKIRNFSFFIIFFASIDQAIKFYLINIYNINTTHLNSQFMEKINDYFNLYLIWNKGFAFGLFQNDLQSINNFYMIIMLVLIIFLFFYAIKINKKIYYFAFSLIIGGAIGNLIDRFLYQAVLDFIDIGRWRQDHLSAHPALSDCQPDHRHGLYVGGLRRLSRASPAAAARTGAA